MNYLTLELGCDSCEHKGALACAFCPKKEALGRDYTEENIRALVPGIIAAHPEGGCWKLHATPSGDMTPGYDPTEGQECWGPRAAAITRPELTPAQRAVVIEAVKKERPELFAPEPAAAGGGYSLWSMYPTDQNVSPAVAGFIDYQNDLMLEGFFGEVGKLLTTPYKAVKRTLTSRVAKKAYRYAGAVTLPSLFMTAGQRKKVFGLSDRESRQFETYSKVGRGVVGAIAVAAGAAYAGPALMTKLGAMGASKGAATAAGGAAKTSGIGALIKSGLGMIAITKGAGGLTNVSTFGSNSLPPEAQAMPDGAMIPFPQDDVSSGMANFGMPAQVAGAPSIFPAAGDDLQFQTEAEQAAAAAAAAEAKAPAPVAGFAVTPGLALAGAGVAVLLFLALRKR